MLSTKAIHLDAVSSYDTKHFMLAFKRFIARRGLCSDIYSDRGTNFVGARYEVKQLFLENSMFSKDLCGLWEAAVKSTRFHIKGDIGENILTYEEMPTLLASVELCLNSRP